MPAMPWSGLSGYPVKQWTRLYLSETILALFLLLIPVPILLQPAAALNSHSVLASVERRSVSETGKTGPPASDYRLLGEVIPVSYNLSLLIDMEKLTTEGEVRIKLRVMRTTSNITLHANQSFLSIKHNEVMVEIEQDDSPKVDVVGNLDDRKEWPREFYTVLLNRTFSPSFCSRH